jgi:hypothetical protein
VQEKNGVDKGPEFYFFAHSHFHRWLNPKANMELEWCLVSLDPTRVTGKQSPSVSFLPLHMPRDDWER